jgi:hypothetical protein
MLRRECEPGRVPELAQSALGWRNICCSNQEIEVAEIAHCRITVKLLSQNRPLVCEDLNAVMFELPQNAS